MTGSARLDELGQMQAGREGSRLRELLRDLEVRPTRGKGQNFLTDRGVVARIADAALVGPGDAVVEVGPGLGILTRELIARVGAEGQVVAVELDRRLAAYLREELGETPTLRLVESDVLRVSPGELVPGDAPYAVVANLPYSIAAAALRHFLDDPRRPASVTVMVQREVAERIVARPPEMSVLAVAVQFYGEPSIALRIGPAAFVPRPKVESAVIRIALRPAPPLPDAAIPGFFKVVAAGFGQKRKQLVNSLGAGLKLTREQAIAALVAAGIAQEQRPEKLTVEDWLRLYEALDRAGVRAIRRRAAAKVNLGLEVVGKRADGYHELVTIFQAIGLYDEVAVEDAPPGQIALAADPALGGEGNLVLRAARALAAHAGTSQGAALALVKGIPVGGLGGGSSDAAATLLALREFWALDITDEELAALATRLGADVPFFLRAALRSPPVSARC
ncbi:MAG: 16S rRNA (adenine(1518)-N(6)/adenine(1519)-N(6))-dimethyltransferase RsmA [Thermomicrobiales bacterium]